MIIVISVLLVLFLLVQYIMILLGIMFDEFKSKENLRKQCIPFYWVYDCFLEFKKSLAKLPEKEE